MIKTETMPIQIKSTNLTEGFAKLNLLLKIQQSVNKKSSFGFAINHAIDKNQPADKILKFIYECWQDNPGSVASVVGEDLLQQILNFQ